jgi:hypothetical protein
MRGGPHDACMSDATLTLMSVKEAAAFLGMIPSRVVRLANKSQVPCVRLPDGEPRFIKEDLYEWIREHRVPQQEKTCTQQKKAGARPTQTPAPNLAKVLHPAAEILYRTQGQDKLQEARDEST